MGKLRPAGKGVLHDDRGRMLLGFAKPLGIMELNEADLRALQVCSRFRRGNLIIECDSTNAISWANNRKFPPWRLISIARDIWRLYRSSITFIHTSHSVNSVADFLAKVGVPKQRPTMEFFSSD